MKSVHRHLSTRRPLKRRSFKPRFEMLECRHLLSGSPLPFDDSGLAPAALQCVNALAESPRIQRVQNYGATGNGVTDDTRSPFARRLSWLCLEAERQRRKCCPRALMPSIRKRVTQWPGVRSLRSLRTAPSSSSVIMVHRRELQRRTSLDTSRSQKPDNKLTCEQGTAVPRSAGFPCFRSIRVPAAL